MSRYLNFEPENKPPFSFLSYNSEDQDRVQEYVKALADNRFYIWYDEGIEKGEGWESIIAENIRNCDLVLMFISKAIFEKADSFVKKEYNRAKEEGKKIIILWLDEPPLSVNSKYSFWVDEIKAIQGVELYNCSSIDDGIILIEKAIEPHIKPGKYEFCADIAEYVGVDDTDTAFICHVTKGKLHSGEEVEIENKKYKAYKLMYLGKPVDDVIAGMVGATIFVRGITREEVGTTKHIYK